MTGVTRLSIFTLLSGRSVATSLTIGTRDAWVSTFPAAIEGTSLSRLATFATITARAGESARPTGATQTARSAQTADRSSRPAGTTGATQTAQTAGATRRTAESDGAAATFAPAGSRSAT
jgi:hypothetical protein